MHNLNKDVIGSIAVGVLIGFIAGILQWPAGMILGMLVAVYLAGKSLDIF